MRALASSPKTGVGGATRGNHGGRVMVLDRPGGGARFRLQLPGRAS